MPKALEKIDGQPSWRLTSDHVEAALTQKGGHLTATFRLDGREINPFHTAPWASEALAKDTPAIIEVLRGDFFCFPFGGNETAYGDEQHPVHGETANAVWKQTSPNAWELETKIRPAKITKEIRLENAIYQRHTIRDASGPMAFGHHAMLRFRTPGLISTSHFRFGQVFPGEFENPVQGGYSSLKPGERFQRLEIVPMANGQVADLSRYPAREGFEDLVMLIGDETLPFAWNAVVFPEEGYVWFCLRDPRVLRHTVLWHSNGGRHYAPWNGHHRAVLGLEDVTANFHHGLAESASPNPLSEEGIPTHTVLDPSLPLVVNTIMGVATVPSTAEHVENIEATSEGIQLEFRDGETTQVKLDLSFLGL